MSATTIPSLEPADVAWRMNPSKLLVVKAVGKVMVFVRLDRTSRLSSLLSSGPSALSVETAPFRRPLSNALNNRQTLRARSNPLKCRG
jgi:hypothetical protein